MDKLTPLRSGASRQKGRLILRVVLWGLLLGASSGSCACSMATADAFRPSLERWERRPGPAQKGGDGAYWEPVPRPRVEVKTITRGKVEPGSSCGDAGIVALEITLPSESAYAIGDFGVYFRVLSGDQPDAIFPDVPIKGLVEGNRMTIVLAWLDGHPSRQIPLELRVEAFLVADDLTIGPSEVFQVTAPAGG